MCNHTSSYDIYTTEPAKVQTVMAIPVQPRDIADDNIYQNITWRRPDKHIYITHYLIQYGPGLTSRKNRPGRLSMVNSTDTSAVLRLPIPKSTTKYSVWVAAVSVAGIGDYSDRVKITYSSETKHDCA